MIRATTPTIEFILPEGMYENSKEILITFKQADKIILNKNKEDLEKDENSKYHIKLTQAETNLFQANIELKIQLRFLSMAGDVCASTIKSVNVKDVLNDQELS